VIAGSDVLADPQNVELIAHDAAHSDGATP